MSALGDPRRRVAIGAGLAGFLVSFGFLRWQESRLEDRASMVQVVSAAEDIRSGTVLRRDHLRLREMPRAYIPPGSLGKVEDAVGQVAIAPFATGEPLLGNKLSSTGSGLASKIPDGHRAFTLPLDESSAMGGLVRPNDIADVLATFEVYQNEREFANFTATLFQAVRILAVGADTGAPHDKEARAAGWLEGPEGPPAKTISLDVTPDQAEILLFCLSNGRVTLSLRSPGDLDFKDIPTATFEEILRRTGLSRARVQELPRRPAVEIIRGTKKN